MERKAKLLKKLRQKVHSIDTSIPLPDGLTEEQAESWTYSTDGTRTNSVPAYIRDYQSEEGSSEDTFPNKFDESCVDQNGYPFRSRENVPPAAMEEEAPIDTEPK